MLDEKLSELYPDITAEEKGLASETLDRYLEIAWEIAQIEKQSQVDAERIAH